MRRGAASFTVVEVGDEADDAEESGAVLLVTGSPGMRVDAQDR
jgi:hypothetical protein